MQKSRTNHSDLLTCPYTAYMELIFPEKRIIGKPFVTKKNIRNYDCNKKNIHKINFTVNIAKTNLKQLKPKTRIKVYICIKI
jgi:hypothetical protein